ncbi:MAG: O-antigen ligase family protein [Chloroflexi bacterium]|nr:O-antigen ligase family protein [Chloroflexota bacterium]
MDFALIWAIRFGLMALLFTPLIVSPSTIFPFIVGKALFSRTVIEITFALWLILMLRRPEYRPAQSKLAIFLGLFVLATLVSAVFGVSFQRSIWSNYERMTGTFDLFHWWAALVIMMSMIKGVTQWRLYLTAFLSIGLFISFLGLLQANEQTWGAFSWLRGQDIGRLTISLGNATYVGSLGMTLSLLGFGLFMDKMWRPSPAVATDGSASPAPRHRGRRTTGARAASPGISDDLRLPIAALYLLVIVAGIYILIESGSRGSLMGLAAGLAAAGIAYSIWGSHYGWRLVSRIALAVLATGVVLFLVLPSSALSGLKDLSPVLFRSVGSTEADQSLHSRGVGTRSALQAFSERPITGYGFENYSTVWNNHLEDDDFLGVFPELDVAHNDPAEILSTTGVLGFTPYALMWIWALWLAYTRFRAREESQWIDLAMLGAIFGFFIHLLFLFDTASTMLVLILMLAYVGATESRVAARAAEHTPGDFLAPRGSAPIERRETSREARVARRRRDREAARSTSMPGTESWSEVLKIWIGPTAIVTVLVLSLVFTQLQPWRAAQKVLLPGTPQDVVQNLDVFTQLGTISRTQFMDVIATELQNIDATDRSAVFSIVEPEVITVIKDQPENMKVRLAAARFYRSGAQNIPERHDELMALAREHTDAGMDIGPFVFESNHELVLQAFAEGNLVAIESAVTNWKQMSWSDAHLARWDERLEDARSSLGG